MTMTIRNPESRPLPEKSPALDADVWPDCGFFLLPCFDQAKAKGGESMRQLAHLHIVATPGTLGEEGAWRVDGHRLSVEHILQLARIANHPLAKEHLMTIATMALIAEEWYGWDGNDPLMHEKIEAALCFSMLYPFEYLKQIAGQGGSNDLLSSFAEKTISSIQARMEAHEIRMSSPAAHQRQDRSNERL